MAAKRSSFQKANTSIDIKLPFSTKTVLGIGAESNAGFCIFSGNNAHISRNFGDISYINNMDALEREIKKKIISTGTGIDIVARDMHPAYSNLEYAKQVADETGAELLDVQHHVAHIYSAALDNGIQDNDFAGIACDGTGYGSDGKIWGGEVFLGNRRVGSLEEHMMIGGESAILNPSKMLFGIISRFLDDSEIHKLRIFDLQEINVMRKQAELGFNVFHTTSCGRVLDAVSAMLGLCRKRTCDAEPAIMLENHALGSEPLDLPPLLQKKKRWILNTTRLFEFIYENLDSDKKRLASTAHHYLASGLFGIAKKYNKEIVFSGGVAHNSIISRYLSEKGVKMNINIPCGDYGLGFGQCAYASIKNMIP